MAITRFFWAWIGQNKEMLFLCLLFKKSSNILSFKFLLFFGKNENNKNSKITSHRWCLLEAFGAWIVKKMYFQLGWIFFVDFSTWSNFFLLVIQIVFFCKNENNKNDFSTVFPKKHSWVFVKKSPEINNGILLPKLFWPVRKNCSSDREKDH